MSVTIETPSRPRERAGTAPPADTAPPVGAERISGRGLGTLLVVLAGTFMAIMDSFVVNVAVPSLRDDLHASFAQVELSISGYVLVYGLLLVTGGRLGDLFGARRLFLLGTGAFTLASLAAGLAPDPVSLVVFRVAQAVGAALFYPQVLAVLQTAFTGAARARAYAAFGATIGLASVAGQVLGGLLIHLDLFGLGWRTVFLVNVPVGLLTLVGARRTLSSSARATTRGRGLDVTGVGLLSGALLLLTVPLVVGGQAGWPTWTWFSLAASVPTLVAFLVWERRLAARGGSPLVDPALFRSRTFSAGNAIALAFFAGNAGLFFVLTLQLQNGMGYSPLAAGLTFAPLAVTFSVASLLAPRLQARLGRHTLTLGYAVNAVGTLALLVTAWAAGDGLTGWLLMPALAVIGLGEGLGVSPLVSTALSGVPARVAGAAAGVVETAGQVGMSLGVTVLGLVFSAALGGTTHTAAPAAVGHAFTVTLVGNLVLALAALALLPLIRDTSTVDKS
ncbi:drug resistance transporter, EmrB/QacA subfamily [Streptoalloteichus tenebrarius]|uniref:Drug resistance transporter, EmrB/QacA subfamily n=1 Tax=Streptoalloteichus tenebrarius (strain ATCC 17920 / DSM 40477 / JCM 4838 / CBS 697.72 / NBRC 16177 / NCIMB 11028 / NRRL B-12390 / A12253. 1 / ISP 5477) TaxID=1933 RepID=A0ABT1HNF6_STRSD|nr:MFS transporter [Streptoalloteichus tenebrarius]MCP2257046.1 drug resistance transporter, EmrB/QacA subfamily [Streptoalloteichus tenebrarius]BFE98674.1 MFS transporter [Streptoalloteichus tenebrarius]